MFNKYEFTNLFLTQELPDPDLDPSWSRQSWGPPDGNEEGPTFINIMKILIMILPKAFYAAFIESGFLGTFLKMIIDLIE